MPCEGSVFPSPTALSPQGCPCLPRAPTPSRRRGEASRGPGLAPRRCSCARPPLDGTFSPTQGPAAAAQAPGGGALWLSPGQVRVAWAVTRGEGCGMILQSKARRVSISWRRRESRGFPQAGSSGVAPVRSRSCARLRLLDQLRASRSPRPTACTPECPAQAGPPRVHRELGERGPPSREVEGGETRTNGRTAGAAGANFAGHRATGGLYWEHPRKEHGWRTLALRYVFFTGTLSELGSRPRQRAPGGWPPGSGRLSGSAPSQPRCSSPPPPRHSFPSRRLWVLPFP